MPSTYAHYRMGQTVSRCVFERNQDLIKKNKQLFDIGLHGPDILFYYRPLESNKVNAIGYEMHERAGREFFEYAAQVIRENDNDSRYLAYVYGMICHFALDATCHEYINEKKAQSGVSHTEIEVEFDRSLMLEDGLEPITHKLTGHIVPSKSNSQVISSFFSTINSNEIKAALCGMIRYSNLLTTPLKMKRRLIDTLLRITGNYKEIHGLMVNFTANPLCEDSTKKLRQLYDTALECAVKLIDEYDQYIIEKQELDSIYYYTFEGKKINTRE